MIASRASVRVVLRGAHQYSNGRDQNRILLSPWRNSRFLEGLRNLGSLPLPGSGT
jgi:hypothetical protein